MFCPLNLSTKDNDYVVAVDALTKYFEPVKNTLYQTYLFRQASQREDETIDEFHTQLRQLAKHCDFHDEDFEIKLQIVCDGKSSRLRKKGLREPELKLQDMIIEGRKSETSSAQASGMETRSTEESHVNMVQKCSGMLKASTDHSRKLANAHMQKEKIGEKSLISIHCSIE